MPTELQNAIKLVENFHENFNRLTPGEKATIVEAAKQVAHLNIEAAIEARFNYITTSREDVTRIVFAALGITEEE